MLCIFFLFIFVERYNLFKILEKLKITLWLCLRHSWWVDPLLVVRGDPYAQSQQPVKLQKKKEINFKEIENKKTKLRLKHGLPTNSS